jgi:hypothetical protein
MELSEKLDIKDLAHEMTMWRKDPGQLRFGQRIWNLYGKPGHSWPELFYEKNEMEAYSLLLAALYVRRDLARA